MKTRLYHIIAVCSLALAGCGGNSTSGDEVVDTLTSEEIAAQTAALQAQRTAQELEALKKQTAADSAAMKALVGHWTGIPVGPGLVEHYVFNPDGTATMWDVGPGGKSETVSFSYTIQGGQIYVTLDGEASPEFTFDGKLLADKMGNAYTKEGQ